MTSSVTYGYWRDGWELKRTLPERLAADAENVCEIGAGAFPLLPPRDGYSLLDVSPAELGKTDAGYVKIVTDICSPQFERPGIFDLVFSLSTAEHIADPRLFHLNTRRLLRRGAVAVHFFPTLYALPFVANRLLGEHLGEQILLKINPRRISSGPHAKFPAYYRWCRGPTRRQIRRLESCGFSVEQYYGYFGHSYYDPLGAGPLLEPVWRWLMRHPVPSLTSYALVVLRAT